MKTQPVVSFHSLSKFYGKHIGIEGLSLDIAPGEIFGFLGPNGAGKTTTIRLLLDLIKPSSGSVKIFGQEVSKHSYSVRQRIGYLPGNFIPFDKMTGLDFLRFSSHMRRQPFREPTHLFEAFDLGKKDLNKRIREYSQGMKQKLGIIHAVANMPELIILDEPSTGLDPLMRDSLYELLINLNKKGSTIFFSSHNLPEVEKICEKVAIVKEGKLVGYESLESLRKKKMKLLRIRLEQDISEPPVLKNAQWLKSHKGLIEYRVTGKLNGLMEELSHLALREIILPEPDLEDIFLGYYEKKQKATL